VKQSLDAIERFRLTKSGLSAGRCGIIHNSDDETNRMPSHEISISILQWHSEWDTVLIAFGIGRSLRNSTVKNQSRALAAATSRLPVMDGRADHPPALLFESAH
jgi:hypothetical protein